MIMNTSPTGDPERWRAGAGSLDGDMPCKDPSLRLAFILLLATSYTAVHVICFFSRYTSISHTALVLLLRVSCYK